MSERNDFTPSGPVTENRRSTRLPQKRSMCIWQYSLFNFQYSMPRPPAEAPAQPLQHPALVQRGVVVAAFDLHIRQVRRAGQAIVQLARLLDRNDVVAGGVRQEH